MSAVRWSTVVTPWFRDDRRFRLLEWAVPPLLAVLCLAAPLPAAVLLGLTVLLAVLWRRPGAVVPMLIVLMGNVKVNYYAGFFTFFPEYIVLAVAAAVLALRWAEERRPLEERGLMMLLVAWVLAGLLSITFAVMPGKVLARVVLIAVAGLTLWLVVDGVRTERELARALAWWEGAALVSIVYGIVQIVGLLLHFDTSLGFLERFGNRAMFYGIGPPAELGISWIFRINGFFSDPNIYAGFMAGATALALALALRHAADPYRRARARFELVLFGLGVLCVFLSLSRSGMAGMVVGCATVLALEPAVMRRPRFWVAAGLGLVVVGALSALMGLNPVLFVVRLVQSFSSHDYSTRVHHEVFMYGLALVARYPLTGVGLGNFGAHYAPDVNAHFPEMMSHCAPLSAFAESGLLGGGVLLAIAGVALWRPWRALRDPGLRSARPELGAALVGLIGALVAIDFANLFYDYYMRTFIWVATGLALAAARLAERRDPAAPGGAPNDGA